MPVTLYLEKYFISFLSYYCKRKKTLFSDSDILTLIGLEPGPTARAGLGTAIPNSCDIEHRPDAHFPTCISALATQV
jgi:hypothetical protein